MSHSEILAKQIVNDVVERQFAPFESNEVAVQPDDSSFSTTQFGQKRTVANTWVQLRTQPSVKRRRFENRAVVVYNLKAGANLQKFSAFVVRSLEEMIAEPVVLLRSKQMSANANRQSVMITFATSEHSDLAISLNGVDYMKQTLFVKAFDPKWKGKKLRKRHLCISHLCKSCLNSRKSCLDAHSVLELKLYPGTVLQENRTRYIKHINHIKHIELVKGRKLYELVNHTRQRLRKLGLNDFVTAFYHRKNKGDAIIEFASAETASRAGEVLAGVHPWKPEYQSIFLDYFDYGIQTDIEVEQKDEEAPMNSLHNIVEMRLYRHTIVDEGRAIYLSGIASEVFSAETILAWMKKKNLFVTKLHFRNDMGDALVEFASPKHATTAVSILNGLVMGQMKISAQPWKAEYQSMFVDYVENQKQAVTEVQKEPEESSNNPTINLDNKDREKPSQDHGQEAVETGDMHAKEVDQNSAMQDETIDLHRDCSQNKQQNNAGSRADDGHFPETRTVSPNESEPIISSTGVSENELKARLAQANSQIELLSSLLERTKENLKATEAEKQKISAEKQCMEKKLSDLEMENESLQEELEQTRMNHQMEMGMAGL